MTRFLPLAFLLFVGLLVPAGTHAQHAVDSVDSAAPGVIVAGLPRRAADSTAERLTALDEPERPASVSDSNVVTTDYPRLSQEEFMNGESPRYTMTGQLPYRETHVNPTTISVFGGGLLGLAAGIMWYQQVWYPDSTKGPFNFKTDIGYSKELDKLGHAYGGWMASYCSHEALIASGFSKEDAALWGSVGGLIWGTWVEVADGFHANYGFDWTDEVANLLGCASFYIQRQVPFFQNFDFKWSVGPSGRDSARAAAQIRSRIVIDDYDAQNIWVSARVHSLLPQSLRPYWPKWLQLAVGYGAKDVELVGYEPYRTLYVSLDYNLVELLPDMGPFMNWLVQGLNAFHLPAPALQILPDVRFKLLYPFDL